LYRSKSQKGVVAAIFLLLFVLSVAPKQFLHDIITGHHHTDAKYTGGTHWESPKNNFLCNWHEQAVESPFIDQPDFQVPQPVIAHRSYVYYSAEHFFSSLRGPPACV
jgi:hypothetical protein